MALPKIEKSVPEGTRLIAPSHPEATHDNLQEEESKERRNLNRINAFIAKHQSVLRKLAQ